MTGIRRRGCFLKETAWPNAIGAKFMKRLSIFTIRFRSWIIRFDAITRGSHFPLQSLKRETAASKTHVLESIMATMYLPSPGLFFEDHLRAEWILISSVNDAFLRFGLFESS